MQCKKCGKEHDGKFGSGVFCSRSCANSRFMTEERKSKISEGVNRYNRHRGIIPTKEKPKGKCKVCGIEIAYGSTFCITHTRSFNPEQTKQKCRLAQLKRIENGTFSGWKSRNVLSYAEKFWIKVLSNNNIAYQANKPYKGYFLDFYIEKNGKRLDLEIDGKQHQYLDRIVSDQKRDKVVIDDGILLYRITWNSINSTKGQLLMKEKINKFLAFYETL